MNINLNIDNNINFQARNPVIKKADDIARHVNALYPRISGTKMYSLDSYACNKAGLNYRCKGKIFSGYRRKIVSVRSLLFKLYKSKKSNLHKCTSYVEAIKDEKAGNCGESSFLARMVAACNGIKNTKIVYLDCQGKNLDHYAVYVDDKKPYIIDSWLGFADYVPNALEKFRGEYRKFVGIDRFTAESELNFVESHGNFITNDKMQYSEKLVNQLIAKYPELVLKQKN